MTNKAIKAIVFDAYGTLYDVQSVERAIEAAFPGRGAFITQVWRLKQLEYTWLRTMMNQYQDFWQVTQESLAYTLDTLGLRADAALIGTIAAEYDRLDLYPDARAALEALAEYKLAIFSNGSPAMLAALVRNSGMGQLIPTVISVDAKRAFKPDVRAYDLVGESLGLPPAEVLFVSSNGFDISGAKSVGFTVARIERVSQQALQAELTQPGPIAPPAMFKALRSQPEQLGFTPDFVLTTLSELASLAQAGFAPPLQR